MESVRLKECLASDFLQFILSALQHNILLCFLCSLSIFTKLCFFNKSDKAKNDWVHKNKIDIKKDRKSDCLE